MPEIRHLEIGLSLLFHRGYFHRVGGQTIKNKIIQIVKVLLSALKETKWANDTGTGSGGAKIRQVTFRRR